MRLTGRHLVSCLALMLAGTGTLPAAPTGNAADGGAARPPAARTASTPPMGWSSWSALREGSSLNQALISYSCGQVASSSA